MGTNVRVTAMVAAAVLLPSTLWAQATISQPYDATLRTDPAVGNVQGIQRYGRPLKTDPDQGEGYSYHVYPVAQAPQTDPALLLLAMQMANQNRQVAGGATSASDREAAKDETLTTRLLENFVADSLVRTAAYGSPLFGPPLPRTLPPFDATAGLRNYQLPLSAPEALSNPLAASAVFRAQAIGIDAKEATKLIELYHQPLIQIKLRVVEVVRHDDLQVNSVLEYVGRPGTKPSYTSGLTANQTGNAGFENQKALSSFSIADLVTAAGAGTGALINLTGQQINWALAALATEFDADIVTAPQVVTLNGQNVEFVAGSKLPFQIGQNVIQGTNNNIQQVFFKSVGTYVSVTPKIVNWGLYGEGEGEAAIAASEITDWNGLARLLLQSQLFVINDDLRRNLEEYDRNQRPIPFEVRKEMLTFLNRYRRSDLLGRIVNTPEGATVVPGYLPGIENVISLQAYEQCQACAWSPENCTIDMSIVVRISEGGTQDLNVSNGAQSQTITTNIETNVRAVANVIQVRSGEGFVMAGLIGEREEEAQAKIPVLGDLPYVGVLFRNKETLRRKTELLIFVEATVLDRRPEVARSQSAEDFHLSHDYIDGSVTDTALERGLFQVGIGPYLPPMSRDEEIFWERSFRRLRKIKTHLDDIRE
jgi:hypothetical protein